MFEAKEKVCVSAHRGGRNHGIENTLTAFRNAMEMGVDMIETDVRMTADGWLVLMHDETVDRTTDGSGLVKELTLEQINRLNAAVHSDKPMAPEAPPLFSELIELCLNYPDVMLNIEFKDYPTPGNEDFAYTCADKMCDMLIEYGVEKRTWINSFSGKILEHVYRRHGDIFHYHGFYPWFILGEMELDPESFIDVACMQHRYQTEDGEVIKYDDPMCPQEWFQPLLDKGIMPLMAPSLQKFPLYDIAFSWGSRIVNTDYPEDMLSHLREKGLHT